ncbi:MAG: hypothetical protein H7Z71_08955 [Moraxellaceae bacterium]|nr:hypothetical protein [Pseudobdellovibrionaceae bacterium]
MKKIIFIISLIYLNTVLADSGITCGPANNLLQNADDVKAVACEEINKSRQCKSQSRTDPNVVRNKFQNFLDITESPEQIERLRQSWNGNIAVNPEFKKFYLDRSKDDIANKVAPIPLTSWLGDSKFSPSAKDRSQIKKALIDKFVAYSQRFDCMPTFELKSFNEVHPKIIQFDDRGLRNLDKIAKLEFMKVEMAQKENIIAAESKMKAISNLSLESSNIDGIEICPTNPEADGAGFPIGKVQTKEINEPCAGNFRKNFDNNKYDFKPDELKSLLAEKDAQDLASCIKTRLAKGAKIKHITITSSASALNNKYEAEKKFCKKGFLELSKARAKTAQEKIIPGLFNESGNSNYDLSTVTMKLNFDGSNKDGTSGPCPYEYKNRLEVPKPPFDTEAGLASLDENRYVKVQITFVESIVSARQNFSIFQPNYNCRKLQIRCE